MLVIWDALCGYGARGRASLLLRLYAADLSQIFRIPWRMFFRTAHQLSWFGILHEGADMGSESNESEA